MFVPWNLSPLSCDSTQYKQLRTTVHITVTANSILMFMHPDSNANPYKAQHSSVSSHEKGLVGTISPSTSDRFQARLTRGTLLEDLLDEPARWKTILQPSQSKHRPTPIKWVSQTTTPSQANQIREDRIGTIIHQLQLPDSVLTCIQSCTYIHTYCIQPAIGTTTHRI